MKSDFAALKDPRSVEFDTFVMDLTDNAIADLPRAALILLCRGLVERQVYSSFKSGLRDAAYTSAEVTDGDICGVLDGDSHVTGDSNMAVSADDAEVAPSTRNVSDPVAPPMPLPADLQQYLDALGAYSDARATSPNSTSASAVGSIRDNVTQRRSDEALQPLAEVTFDVESTELDPLLLSHINALFEAERTGALRQPNRGGSMHRNDSVRLAQHGAQCIRQLQQRHPDYKLTQNRHYLTWQTQLMIEDLGFGAASFTEYYTGVFRPGVRVNLRALRTDALEAHFSQIKEQSHGEHTARNFTLAEQKGLQLSVVRGKEYAENRMATAKQHYTTNTVHNASPDSNSNTYYPNNNNNDNDNNNNNNNNSSNNTSNTSSSRVTGDSRKRRGRPKYTKVTLNGNIADDSADDSENDKSEVDSDLQYKNHTYIRKKNKINTNNSNLASTIDMLFGTIYDQVQL